jgi:hypothetical protein
MEHNMLRVVEWSCDSQFTPVSGSVEVRDLRRTHVHLTGLVENTLVYVRVAAGNYAGYSMPTYAQPAAIAPSCE